MSNTITINHEQYETVRRAIEALTNHTVDRVVLDDVCASLDKAFPRRDGRLITISAGSCNSYIRAMRVVRDYSAVSYGLKESRDILEPISRGQSVTIEEPTRHSAGRVADALIAEGFTVEVGG